MNRLHRTIAPALLAGVLAAPMPTIAQDDEGQLEEIIVTARKREENLQDVPASISVVTGQMLRETNIRNLEQLGALIAHPHRGRRQDSWLLLSHRCTSPISTFGRRAPTQWHTPCP